MDCCGVKSHDEIRGLTELLKLYISRNMDAFSLDVRYCFIVPGGGFMPGRLADVWLTPLPEGMASPRGAVNESGQMWGFWEFQHH